LLNQGTIFAGGGGVGHGRAPLTIDTGSNAIINTGSIVASGDTVTVNSPITGVGTDLIQGGGKMVFNASVSSGQTVDFSGGGTLQLDKSALFTGTISGLTKSNAVDLADLSWVSGKMKATFVGNTSGGVLTVTNGATSINLNLSGNYTKSRWNLSQDGTGGTLVVDPPINGALAPNAVPSGSQTPALASASNQTSDPFITASDSYRGTTITDPTTPWPDSPLQWLEQHVPSILSEFQDFQHGDGLTQLLNQVENWSSPSGSLTPTTNGQSAQSAQSNSLDSWFDAGWKSHMTQTMASFVDSKGGPPPGVLIQTNDQMPQIVLAGSTQYHS
jgi:hypothetical protein